jgi:hypothetical protein
LSTITRICSYLAQTRRVSLGRTQSAAPVLASGNFLGTGMANPFVSLEVVTMNVKMMLILAFKQIGRIRYFLMPNGFSTLQGAQKNCVHISTPADWEQRQK